MKPTQKRLTAILMAAIMIAPACSLSAFAADAAPAPDAIVCEDMSQRDENTKVFQKKDGTYVALATGAPVHYQKDGRWTEIDNTLEKARDAQNRTVYTNKSNACSITLPERMDGSQPVTLTHQGYTLSFVLENQQDTSNKIDIDRQKAAPGASDTEKRAGLEKRTSAVTYENIDKNTDLQYIVSPTKLTENIILDRAPDAAPTYRFLIQADGLTPVMNEGRSIDFKDAAGEAVFTIPAPYMYDKAAIRSDDVQSQLEANADGSYSLTYLPSLSWLQSADRQYPVTVDPDIIFSKDLSENFLIDTYVDRSAPDTNFQNSELISLSNMDGQEQSIYCDPRPAAIFSTKKNILSTKLRYHQAGYFRFSDQAVAGIYEIERKWDQNTITYNNQPSVQTYPFDTAKLKGDTLEFDITKQFKLLSHLNFLPESLTQPSSSPFYGFAIRVLDADTKGISWYDSDNSTYAEYGPVLEMAYTNQTGTPVSEDTHRWDLGAAGLVTLNDYTGFITIDRKEMGVADARMPVQINRHFDSANSTFSFQNEFGMASPYGGYWQTNYNRILYRAPASVLGVNDTIKTVAPTYQYLDGDGTIYDFAYAGPAANGFELWRPSAAPQGTPKDLCLYLPQNIGTASDYNRAYLIENNALRINFNSAGQMSRITDLQNEAAAVQLTYLSIESDENDIFPHQQIDQIVDSEGRTYRFTYSENKHLSAIACYNADGTPYLIQNADGQAVPYTVTYGYNSENGAAGLIKTTFADGSVIDYETASNLYNYFPSTLGDPASGSALGIAYDKGTFRVSHIEYYENETLSEQFDTMLFDLNQVVFAYGDNDYILKQYDGQGQLISVFDETGKMLSLRGSDGVMHNAPANAPYQESFENGLTDGWSATGLAMNTGDQAHTGIKSMMMINNGAITKQSAEPYEKATASVYFKTPTASSDIGGKLTVLGLDTQGNVLYTQSSALIGGTNGQWVKAAMDFALPTGTAAVKFAVESVGSGIVYADDFYCIEAGMVMDATNLIRNPDFTTEFNPITDWSAPAETEVGRIELDEYDASYRAPGLGLDNFVGGVGGNIRFKNGLSQTITINGKAGESFCYGTWTMAYSAVLKEARSYSIRVDARNADGTTALLAEHTFDPNVALWQYGGDFFTLANDVEQVIVSLNYNYQTSAAMFDGVHLNRVTL